MMNLFSDPMFWALAVALNLFLLVNKWTQEGNICLFKLTLVIALIANSICLGLSMNYGC